MQNLKSLIESSTTRPSLNISNSHQKTKRAWNVPITNTGLKEGILTPMATLTKVGTGIQWKTEPSICVHQSNTKLLIQSIREMTTRDAFVICGARELLIAGRLLEETMVVTAIMEETTIMAEIITMEETITTEVTITTEATTMVGTTLVVTAMAVTTTMAAATTTTEGIATTEVTTTMVETITMAEITATAETITMAVTATMVAMLTQSLSLIQQLNSLKSALTLTTVKLRNRGHCTKLTGRSTTLKGI